MRVISVTYAIGVNLKEEVTVRVGENGVTKIEEQKPTYTGSKAFDIYERGYLSHRVFFPIRAEYEF